MVGGIGSRRCALGVLGLAPGALGTKGAYAPVFLSPTSSVSTKVPSIACVITATLVLTSVCGGGGRFSRLQESSTYGVDTLCIETAPDDCASWS